MHLAWFVVPISQASKTAQTQSLKASSNHSVREVEPGDAAAMSFLCSCVRRQKNKDTPDGSYYGKYSKQSSETPMPSIAPTPRVRRKFPEGVRPLPHASSDVSIQKGDDVAWKQTFSINNNTLGSDSEIEDIERTLLSICEQEEERLKHSEIISQLSAYSESDSDSEEGDDDTASMTSQDLEDLLVTTDDVEHSSFSEDSDGPEEPVHRFTLRPRDTLRERYAEYSNEIWQDIQVSLIEAISSKHSSVQGSVGAVEAADPESEDVEERQQVFDDTVHVFRAGRFQITSVPDEKGASCW